MVNKSSLADIYNTCKPKKNNAGVHILSDPPNLQWGLKENNYFITMNMWAWVHHKVAYLITAHPFI